MVGFSGHNANYVSGVFSDCDDSCWLTHSRDVRGLVAITAAVKGAGVMESYMRSVLVFRQRRVRGGLRSKASDALEGSSTNITLVFGTVMCDAHVDRKKNAAQIHTSLYWYSTTAVQ